MPVCPNVERITVRGEYEGRDVRVTLECSREAGHEPPCRCRANTIAFEWTW